jgi:hypothetical protein
VVVAWYGTPTRTGDVNDAAAMGPAGARSSAAWYLYLAESFNAGRSWHQTRVGSAVHFGQLCTQGTTCGVSAADHTMYEDFGIVIDPVTGRPVTAYMDDQPGGTQATDHVVTSAAVG